MMALYALDGLLVDYNIRTMDQIISVLSSDESPSRHTALKSPLDGRAAQSESAGRDVTGAANSLAAPCFMTLSNGDTIRYHVVEVLPHCWNAWDDNDTEGGGGWGDTADEAVEHLRELYDK